MEGAIIIQTMFGRALKDGQLEKWQATNFRTHTALDTSNWYFSSHRYNSSATPIPFPELVDPKGILAGLAGDELVHCEENQVQYFEFTAFDDANLMSVFALITGMELQANVWSQIP